MQKNEVLLDLRTKNGLTQQQMADLAGVGREHYNRWEAGARPLPPLKYSRLLRRLAAAEEDASAQRRQQALDEGERTKARKKAEAFAALQTLFNYITGENHG